MNVGLYPFNVLSLCSGIGGIDLGLQRAGIRTTCYVEHDAYRIQVLIARMQDGSLDEAPIWDDLTTFDGKPWRGCVDIVSAGFPCQPFSVAGDMRGEEDKRYLWPHIFRIICDVRPHYVLLENVPGLLMAAENRPAPMGKILADLAQGGYDAEWDVLPAAAFGASHLRERVFVVAYPSQGRWQRVLCRDLQDRIQAHLHGTWQTPIALASVWDRLSSLEQSLGEPSVLGTPDGFTYQMERLAAIGETVLPRIAEYLGMCILQAQSESRLCVEEVYQ